MVAARTMTLAALLDAEAAAPSRALGPIAIGGLCLDSRDVSPGDLYVALGGARTHGLRHAAEALGRGAAAVAVDPREIEAFDGGPGGASDALYRTLRADGAPLVEIGRLGARAPALAARLHDHPDRALTLVAVTGTDGKSSVCRFVAAALESLGTPCGYVGTLGWGRGAALGPTSLTTPDALALVRMLAALRDGGARAVALEASSHGIASGRLDALAIDVAVLTNLGRDHLDYHGDLASYRRAKARLFERDALDAIVVNGGDSLGRELAARDRVGTRRVVFHGVAARADAANGGGDGRGTHADARAAGDTGDAKGGARALHVAAESVRATATGLAFTLVEGELRQRIESPLMGRFNVDNLLACHGVLRALGHPPEAAAGALGALVPVAGRMERFAPGVAASDGAVPSGASGGVPSDALAHEDASASAASDGSDGDVGVSARTAVAHGEAGPVEAVPSGRPTVVVDYAHTPQALAAALAAARDHCAGALWVVFGCGGDRDPGKRAPMGRTAEAAADHVVVTDDNPRTEASADIIDAVLAGMHEPARATVVPDRRRAIAHAVRAAGANDLVLVAGKGHEDYQIVGERRLALSDRDCVRELLAEAC